MAMKTMLRQLISKWGIMSIDLQTALDKDMAVIQEDGTAEYVENGDDADVVSEQEAKEVPESEPEQSISQPVLRDDPQMSMEDMFFGQ